MSKPNTTFRTLAYRKHQFRIELNADGVQKSEHVYFDGETIGVIFSNKWDRGVTMTAGKYRETAHADMLTSKAQLYTKFRRRLMDTVIDAQK